MNVVDLVYEYKATRSLTEELCNNLFIEDYVIQSMEDVSPPKWHLAHTTWFFETFILSKYAHYKNPNPLFSYIFNSYYQGIGTPYPRNKRGLLARPSVQHIYNYRKEIDTLLVKLITGCPAKLFQELEPLVVLGINHEQQHQELLLMDIKYNFFMDPSLPSYFKKIEDNPSLDQNITPRFFSFESGLFSIGYEGEGFCFDNEQPKHLKYISPFSISNTLVSNQDYLEFMDDKGYANPTLWLADGWIWLQTHQIIAPLYWYLQDEQWMQFTLSGSQSLNLSEPVSHISYYEADAFARWKGCRLPTEEEWEYTQYQLKSNHHSNTSESFLFGDLWEWTSSAYLPYPGYKPLSGFVGEYNGKFMNNQRVLRGASFATPRNHIRPSYRNFYAPDKRWQFSGIRLAKDD